MTPESIDLSGLNFTGEIPVIDLRGRTFDDRQQLVPVLLETMANCGCWLLERKEVPPNAARFSFELQLRSVFELYSGLLSCGVDLSRDSHTSMKSLCTVRDHNPHRAKRRRIVTVRLELIFMDALDATPDLARTAMGVA
jgi:hypothetical protein